ncbi:MAG: DUF3502 domain-containing protein, partial [Eubacteriales bacterium]|nr:DUF3502 domain-containing protein [Eubacteriales bacterium]
VLLTSGEQIDGIFAANWANFYSYAASGAFTDLTDLIPTYAPNTKTQLTDQMWSEGSVDGKIYAIGTNYKEYTPGGFIYREDWRKELGCAPITSIETAEAYFRAVKEQKGITPLNGTANGIILRMNVWYGGDFYHIAGEESLIVKVKGYDTPRNVVSMVHDESYMAMAKRAAQWAKEGFWPADAINSQTGTDVTLKAGTGAAHQCNPAGARGIIQEQTIQGNPAEFEYFCYTELTGVAVANISSNNCFAVPKSAKYPERTVAAVDYIRSDRDAYNIIFYGIEGKHYSVTAEGKLQVPAEGQDPTVVKGWDYANWNFRNPEMFINPVVDWDKWESLNEHFETQYKDNIHWPFYLNKDPIATELAAMAQVTAEYDNQIIYGMGADPEKMVNDYRAALEKAGLQKVIDEVSRQLFAYYDSVGIK